MALWFELKVNHDHIGTVEIRRREHLDLTDRAAIASAWCTYTVRQNGHLIGEVRHRYGDGAWRLLALATDLIGEHIAPPRAADRARLAAEGTDTP